MALLITKTHTPTPRSNLISRSHLLSRLNLLLDPGYQLAVISAPAGFGKTTILSQWLRMIPDTYRVGWFSLDITDNHLTRFFSYVAAALHNADPSFGENFSELIEVHPELTADEIVSYIINKIAKSPKKFLLIIDDIHLINDKEIHQALELLVDHISDNLRLVFVGRVDPYLPLSRFRARGQLVEIRTNDLRFTINETSDLLKKFPGFSSSEGDLVNEMYQSTEGWIAGLQMTFLALRSELEVTGGEPKQIMDRFLGELKGSHRYILDYLLDEVLSHVGLRVREFLLRTCILEGFNADICSTLCMEETDIAQAQNMLEELEHANLFIIPLDHQRKWYRYHHLFKDMLQKQLLHTYPGLESKLHQRAACWFEKHQMLDEAIEHAYQTKDVIYAQNLVEKYSLDFILRGQISTAVRWLNSLPVDVQNTSPRLCLDRAWALTFTSQTETAGIFLERAEILLKDKPGDTNAIKSEILGLRSFQKCIYGEVAEALCLAELSVVNSPKENLFLQCSSRMFLAIALVRNGKFVEAMDEYRFIQSTFKDENGLAGLGILEADFLQFLAVSHNFRQETKQAIRLLKEAIHTFESSSNDNRKAATLYLYVGLGKILYFANQLDEAESALKTGLRIDSLSLSFAAIDGWTTLWWVKIGQRNYPAARSIVNDLESSTQNCDEKISRLVILPAILQDLFEEKIDSAVKRLEHLGFSDDVNGTLANISDIELMSWRVNEFFVYARVLSAKRKHQLGLRVLDRMAQAAQAVGMDWVLYRTWLTQAIVYSSNDQKDIAMEIMEKLLEKTSQAVFGAVQIYLSTGEQARNLLLEAQRRGIYSDYIGKLLAEFPVLIHPEPIPDSPEMLSEREIEVLYLMAKGMKNQEIADKLVVSLNTVRYHSKNIFSKLGVGNRTAAVIRARELALLK
ncbi:MAG: hypothetical protein CL609_18790 [Anaerolineaceae bacterium]|nr:hypothetical protein [Anaerolineaceae bacterium]